MYGLAQPTSTIACLLAAPVVNEPATANTDTTEISSTNGQTLVRSRQAFASSDLVQAQTFFPGVNFSNCTCEFTRWGFWSADNYRSNSDLTTETDRTNLMTWVAGRLAAPPEIPVSGTAVYNGFMVGSFKSFINNTSLAATSTWRRETSRPMSTSPLAPRYRSRASMGEPMRVASRARRE